MLAAFGRTLIAADDATAARVVAESGCPCITPAGTLHERGKLTGGWRSAEPSLFVALLERQQGGRRAQQMPMAAAAHEGLADGWSHEAHALLASTYALPALQNLHPYTVDGVLS